MQKHSSDPLLDNHDYDIAKHVLKLLTQRHIYKNDLVTANYQIETPAVPTWQEFITTIDNGRNWSVEF